MVDLPPTVAFLWHSSSLTGAQRRMLALSRALNDCGQRAIVVLEARDAQAMERLLGGLPPFVRRITLSPWLHAAGRGRGKMRRLWWYSGLRQLYHAALRRELGALQRRENVGLWHVCMSTEFAHCTQGPILFEVTSPDWADRLATGHKIVPATTPLHAVSASVALRLRARPSGRKIIEAPLLFPNLDPAATRPPNMEAKEKLIVFAHRLIPRKNGLLFARAARRFLRNQPDWRVAIRGKGPDEPAIRETLAAEIAAGRVLAGYSSNLSDELRRARIFVSIITPDNYPSQSVVEAMTAGNALLLSDMGQSREKFLDGNGLSVRIEEDEVLDCLNAMASRPEQLVQMGQQSIRLAGERFSQRAYLEHLAGVYRSCGFESERLAAMQERTRERPVEARGRPLSAESQ